jgi:D-xylonolactonase
LDYEITKLASPNAIVGEGPVWDGDNNILYWTDIQGGRFFKFDPSTNENEQIHNGVNVGGLRVNKNGGLILGTWEGVMLWESDENYKWIKEGTLPDKRNTKVKINDATSGPDGSFYCGTDASDYEKDVLFRVNPDETIDIIDEGVKLCNGMGFSPDETIFYSTDTIQKIIYKWDYNKSTREISNKRVFVKNDAPDQGLTDGMTIDSEGYVWSAIWWGSKVMRFDPDGKLEREIHIPASQTSCVMFGGKDLNELYVSTASFGSGSTELMGIEPEGYDLSTYRGGDLFRVKLDIQGKPEYKTNFNW